MPSINMMYWFKSRGRRMTLKEGTGEREKRGNVREHSRKTGRVDHVMFFSWVLLR